MQQATELKKQLQSIHRKSYPAYKSLKGSYQFGHYILSIDHVQGDPFASPSHISVHISRKDAGFPDAYSKNNLTCITLADHLTRQFEQQINHYSFRAKGSGKSGLISVSTVDRKSFPEPHVKSHPKASLPDFLLVFLQMAVPLMHPNWKRFCSIFFLPV